MDSPDAIRCGTCEVTVAPDEAIRRRTVADLDADRWQTFCCPRCGRRLRTVFVGA